MTTLSIPVSAELRQKMEQMIQVGDNLNIAEIGRKAIQKYVDQWAVNSILQAKKEPTLYGDLDELAEKL